MRKAALADVETVQLATRIPGDLRRAMRLHCIAADTSVIEFVTAAVREKLAREGAAQA